MSHAPAAERLRWHRIAANIGVLAAPAGFNFLTSGATEWLYVRRDEPLPWLGAKGFVFRGTGVRIAPDTEGVERHLLALRLVDSLWEQRAPRLRLRERPWPAPQIRPIDVPVTELDWRRFLLRSAAVLDRLRLVDEYHRPRKRGPGYIFDFVENGVTLLTVQRSR